MRLPTAVALALLAGCATTPSLPQLDGVDALLVGEQHDATAHPGLQQRYVRSLADRGRLAAVAIEMAEQGTSTAAVARDAGEDEVRRALRWDEAGWPWPRYRPAVMAAVRAGVPVLGANLPRSQMRAAMGDVALDRLLPGPALKAQQQAVRLGHCEMLPESQITPMTRVQIARDRAMAETIAAAAVPGKTVVLIAGAGHVAPDVGVPRYLPAGVTARSLPLPGEDTGKDYCEEMRRQMPKSMSSRP